MLFLVCVMFFVSICSGQNGEKPDMQTIFKTPEKAAKNGQTILVQLLDTYKEYNLDIDVEKLKRSDLTKLVEYKLIDFDRILSTDSVSTLSELVKSSKGILAPFILDREIVCINQVRKVQKGWQVNGLGNKAIRNDLNSSRIMLHRNATVSLYEVPNLHLFIYGAKDDSGEKYYLDFERFTTKSPVSLNDFYSIMQKKAIEFQEKYGDRLKKEQLLK
jgi:hypothetical protein